MYFIAEIGSNWLGDIQIAKGIIKKCKEAGADAVKFQMWRADDLYQGKYKEYELTFEKAKIIKQYCDFIGIEFFCSVFYPEAVGFLESLGVKRYKLASRTWLESEETIQAVGNTNKPMIYSNPHHLFYTKRDIDRELYCIPEYPANPDKIDWKELLECDGFSDHTLGIEMALKYARLRPDSIIEKHVKLDDNLSPDSPFSITTQELATLITLSTS